VYNTLRVSNGLEIRPVSADLGREVPYVTHPITAGEMSDPTEARPRATLTWWILALALVPMLGAAGWALLALSRHPENESDRAAAAALLRVAPAVEQALDAQADHLARLGSVIARDPKFYAVLTLPSASRGNAEFREALEGVLRDFQREADAPVFAVTDPKGRLLGRALEPSSGAVDLSDAAFVRAALRGGKPGAGYLVERNRIYRVATVPISAGGVLVGTLTLGRPVDEMGARLKTALESDITLVVDRGIAATTLVPSPLRKSLSERLSERTLGGEKGEGVNAGEAPVIPAGGRRYLAVRRGLDDPLAGGSSLGYVLTRQLGSDASPLAVLKRDLLQSAGLGLALALVCGAIVALAVSRDGRRKERVHQEAVEALAESDRFRSGLMAEVAKRVLDPAETVYTITDLVADGALGELSGPQREGILAIRRASRGLTRMARDLSTVALVERGDVTLSPAPVEVGNVVEQAATMAIPVASERRQMVELSMEPGLIHPRLDEGLFSRAIEALTFHVVDESMDATKVILGARKTSGGIEVLIQGAERDGQRCNGSQHEDLAVVMARLVMRKHEGTFEVLDQDGFGYRLWIPLPMAPPPGIGAPVQDAQQPAAGEATGSGPDPAQAA
jgi:Double sensory domain of two-component sensor kinase